MTKSKEQFPDNKVNVLVSLVKDYPDLYDIKSARFHDKVNRKVTFESIAARLGVSGE